MTMMKAGLVSVVVPVYNGEQYIERCLNSLGAQTYGNIEVHIVDDGSTDSTATICEAYCSRDDRFILHTVPNGGVSAARNVGIEHARGEFVCFIDSDDYVTPDYVEWHLGNISAEPGIDISVCGFVDEDERGEVLHRSENTSDYVYDITAFDASRFLPYTCWQTMMRRSALTDAEGRTILFDQDVHIKEDLLFLYAVIANSRRIAVGSKVIYHSVYRSDSLSHGALNEDGVGTYLSSLKVYRRIMEVTAGVPRLHRYLCLNVLKDTVKVSEHLKAVHGLDCDSMGRIRDIRSAAVSHLGRYDLSAKERLIVLMIRRCPALYRKIAR